MLADNMQDLQTMVQLVNDQSDNFVLNLNILKAFQEHWRSDVEIKKFSSISSLKTWVNLYHNTKPMFNFYLSFKQLLKLI